MKRIATWAEEKSSVPRGPANLIAGLYIATERAPRNGRWAVFRTRVHTRVHAGVSPRVGTDNSTVIITESGSRTRAGAAFRNADALPLESRGGRTGLEAPADACIREKHFLVVHISRAIFVHRLVQCCSRKILHSSIGCLYEPGVMYETFALS